MSKEQIEKTTEENNKPESKKETGLPTSKIAIAIQKVNDFYKSNWAFAFFMSATTIFAFVQVILYATNSMAVNGMNIDAAGEEGKIVSSWILLSASIIGCYCGFVGGIMLFRGHLSFVYWQNISTILATITQALASMWFGAFVSVYFIIMNLTRYVVWKNELLDKWNWSNEKVVTVGLLIFIVVFIVMGGTAFLFGDTLYSNATWMEKRNYLFDATGASFNIGASFLMLFKSRWAFALYAIAKIFTIWNYADAGLIVPIVQMMLFWIMDATGFIGWSTHSIKAVDTAVELDFE